MVGRCSAAALLARWRERRAEDRERLIETLLLRRGEVAVERLGLGEVRQQAVEAKRWRRGEQLGRRAPLGGRQAEPMHAGVDLEVDALRRGARGVARDARRAAHMRSWSRLDTAGVRRWARTSSISPVWMVPSTRMGRPTPARRSLAPSSTSATPSQSAPCALERARDRDRAVPVGVGLDHREDRARRRRAGAARAGCAASASRSISTQAGRRTVAAVSIAGAAGADTSGRRS